MENEVADTGSDVQTDTSTAETPEAQTNDTDAAQPTTESYVPFKAGKEKFKINGQEEEWDWEQTKRYAQLGKAGQKAMQEKAESERKQKDFFARLIQGMESDPSATYEALTGKRAPFSVQRAQQAAAAGEQQESENPLESRLRMTEAQLGSLLQQQEAAAVDRERQLIEQELDSSATKFPEINSPWLKSYVKQQYKALLQQGIHDMTIEDVAFMVSEEVKSKSSERNNKLIQKVDENKQKAPVITGPGSGKNKPAGGLEYARKLAGLQ